jgi:hypothetical protein
MSCLCGLFGAKIRIILIGCKFFRKIFYCSHRWLLHRQKKRSVEKRRGHKNERQGDKEGDKRRRQGDKEGDTKNEPDCAGS